MLGASLDYFIARNLAHGRNPATEQQLAPRPPCAQ